MPSVCSGQYPRRVIKEGELLLWNPVTRTALRNRPEERVRLRLIEYLLSRGWPRTRISAEQSHRSFTEQHLRTDLICYDGAFQPSLLVECKAESVAIGERAARQAARYNEEIGAPFLLLTNGRRDCWYETGRSGDGPAGDGQRPLRLEGPPDLSELDGGGESPVRDFPWWRERGFLGGETPAELRGPLAGLLDARWSPADAPVRFFAFEDAPAGYDIGQYYLIEQAREHRVALAPVRTPGEETRFTAVLNRGGENVALALFAPRLAGAEGSHTVTVHGPEGVRTVEAGQVLRLEPLSGEEEEAAAGKTDASLGEVPGRWAGELERLCGGEG